MKTLVQKAVLASATFATVAANAHPGHDHALASSSAIHAVFYISIAAVVASAAFVAVKKFKNQ